MVGLSDGRRYNIGMRAGTNSAQKVPSDYADLLHTFRKTIIIARKTHKIEPLDIVNMDQTMCRFDMPPSRTNNKKGEKTIHIKTTRAEKKGLHSSTGSNSVRHKTSRCDHF